MLVWTVTLLLVGTILYLNISVSYCVFLSEGFSRKQKINALVLCWLLPIIGSCLILYSVLDDVPIIRKKGLGLGHFLFLSWVIALNKTPSDIGCNAPESVDDDS